MRLCPARWLFICLLQRKHQMQNLCRLKTRAYKERVRLFLYFFILCQALTTFATILASRSASSIQHVTPPTPSYMSSPLSSTVTKHNLLKDYNSIATDQVGVKFSQYRVFCRQISARRRCRSRVGVLSALEPSLVHRKSCLNFLAHVHSISPLAKLCHSETAVYSLHTVHALAFAANDGCAQLSQPLQAMNLVSARR